MNSEALGYVHSIAKLGESNNCFIDSSTLVIVSKRHLCLLLAESPLAFTVLIVGHV